MFQKLKARFGLTTIILFGLVYLFVFLVIINSLHRPLWWDEAWRADFINLNLHVAKIDRQNYAPMSLGLFLFGKLSTIFFDNNFTVRLSSYLAFLAFPYVVYIFCKKILNKRTALIMLPLSVAVGYILQFSTQNKPYILDIVGTLLVLLAYQKFKEKKLRLGYYIAICLSFLVTSFASFFLLPCIALLMMKDYYSSRSKLSLRNLIIWLIGIGLATLVYLTFFIKPQLTTGLNTFWRELYFSGNAIVIFNETLKNLLSMFGISYGKILVAPGTETNTVYWLSQQLSIRYKVVGFSTLIGSIYLGLFLYGFRLLYKEKKFVLLIPLGGMYILEWITAFLHVWPFGNARTNLFTTFLVTLVICYAGIKVIPPLFNNYRVAISALFITFFVLLFPYTYIANSLSNSNRAAFEDGSIASLNMQTIASLAAAHSQLDDLIFVDYDSGPFSFQYYYQFSDYNTKYVSRTKHVYYGKAKTDRYAINDQLLASHPPSIWLVESGPTTKADLGSLIYNNYHIQRSFVTSDISLVLLTRI